MTANTDTRTEIREIVRDTTIVIPPDSAWLRALLECDSAGNVLMSKLETYKGRNAAIGSVNLSPEPNNSKVFNLQIGFIVDSLKRELKLRDKLVSYYKDRCEILTQYTPKPYPWWAKTLMWMGGILICLIITATVVVVVKIFR